MKLQSTLVAAISFAAIATSQAFVIDFNALIPTGTFSVGDTISSGSELDVSVDGYGYVTFENNSSATADGDLVIGTSYSDGAGSINSLEMETGETVTVIFKGASVTDVEAGFAGVSAAPFDTGIFQKVVDCQVYTDVSIDSSHFPGGEYQGADGVGLEYVQWNIVPEPSSAALGAIGLSMILFRRRNA